MSTILYNAYVYFTKLKLTIDESTQKKINIMGYYDSELKIWYNGWSIYDPNNHERYELSQELLKYGLKIERDMVKSDAEKAIIKSILVNSRFFIEDEDIQINVILSLMTYLTNAKSYSVYKIGSISLYSIEINDYKN
jgi:hypothetical protein